MLVSIRPEESYEKSLKIQTATAHIGQTPECPRHQLRLFPNGRTSRIYFNYLANPGRPWVINLLCTKDSSFLHWRKLWGQMRQCACVLSTWKIRHVWQTPATVLLVMATQPLWELGDSLFYRLPAPGPLSLSWDVTLILVWKSRFSLILSPSIFESLILSSA